MTRSADPSRRQFLHGAGLVTGGVVGHSIGAPPATEIRQTPTDAGSAARFRGLLERTEPSRCVNCGDVATAKLAEIHGFEIVMTGGSALSLSKYGFGDFGMITMDDLVEFCTRTADAIDIPIIADADDGGGNPLNVYRTIQRMEKAGAACIMFEDLYGAKHLTGYDEGKIISRQAMVDKVHAAVDARRNQDMVLLVRSDVLADGGPLDEALERVALYAQEGGDVIFVPGIPLDQCRRAVEMAGRPILTGAPSVDDARDNGVGIFFIGAMGGIALDAIDAAMTTLARDGRLGSIETLDNEKRRQLIGTDTAIDQARRYNAHREDGQ
ncbi:MAG: isocitrate lyase/PEP mutase family protein [Acidobacteriota bacterium]|nr:isocitrate lyase/PEP mutase family protein [Acidobacteriota bacterium]